MMPKAAKPVSHDDDDEGDGEGKVLDMLTVLNALGRHFRERRQDLLAWSWKLFVAQWAIFIDDAGDERARDEERQAERERRALEPHLQQQLALAQAQ